MYFCSISMKHNFSRQIFEKYSDIKFHENPSCGSRVFTCGQTEKRADGQTDMTKLTVAFHSFANDANNVRDRVTILKYRAVGSTQYTGSSVVCGLGLGTAQTNRWLRTCTRKLVAYFYSKYGETACFFETVISSSIYMMTSQLQTRPLSFKLE